MQSIISSMGGVWIFSGTTQFLITNYDDDDEFPSKCIPLLSFLFSYKVRNICLGNEGLEIRQGKKGQYGGSHMVKTDQRQI